MGAFLCAIQKFSKVVPLLAGGNYCLNRQCTGV
nr:MAG TPA: hypothetical protein [Caudoviricetes sp.]